MTFYEQLIQKNKTAKEWGCILCIWIVALLLATFFLYVGMGYLASSGFTGVFFLAILLCFGLGWGAFWLTGTQYVEFEYQVFEGGLDIDRITHKSNRKRIVQVSAQKIEQLSPISAYNKNEKYDRVVQAAPSKNEATWFITYQSKKNGHTIVFFAPSDELFAVLYKDQTRAVQQACDTLRGSSAQED
ncbi:MAG: hypothetical protein J6Z00_00660 [Clostridia bacterium]|nr:hypothetical protein [Clostridia bacterium]